MKTFQVFRMEYKGGVCTSDLDLPTLTPGRADAYLAMYNAAFREMREALECSPTDFYYSAAQLTDKMKDIYILEKDGCLVGSVALYGREIDDLAVVPEFQGRGYGRALLRFAVARLQAQGSEPITLSVADWNRRAINLYQSMGFETVQTIIVGGRKISE